MPPTSFWIARQAPSHRLHALDGQHTPAVPHEHDLRGGLSTFSYLNLTYLFYSCTNRAGIAGIGNLSGVRQVRYTFSSCAFTSIDFRGFDPSTLTDLFYCFSGCSSLVTIYADSTWTLPTSGLTLSQCFYSCSNLVGGNGTAWSSSNTAYTYMLIDTAATPRYLTAA